MSENRRHFSRITFDAPCLLQQGDRSWHSQVLDVSLKGLLVARPEGFDGDLSKPFEGTLMLTDQGPSIIMDLECRHEGPEQLGFHCGYMDLESMSHLRRLVELNLADDQLLHRELAALVDPTNA
ncbi:MAG: PilZ domain-containing protein [Oleiphilaceae bacterium]|nr:PilZ domain-containing protein [Oleiphilaceae bacterium]